MEKKECCYLESLCQCSQFQWLDVAVSSGEELWNPIQLGDGENHYLVGGGTCLRQMHICPEDIVVYLVFHQRSVADVNRSSNHKRLAAEEKGPEFKIEDGGDPGRIPSPPLSQIRRNIIQLLVQDI